MRKPTAATDIPTWAREAWNEAHGRVENTLAAKALWTRVFTDADRRKCGGDLAAAWAKGNTSGLWCTARGTSPDRAVVDVAYALNFLTAPMRDALLDALGEERSDRDPEKPHWDKRAGELRFRGAVVRRVPKVARSRNIVPILDAFEEDGWPPEIDDPLTSGGRDDRRRRAVETLNNRMLKPWMWFECNGDGTGFRWRAKPRQPAKKAAKRKRR
jgi:hypothetical protein